MNLKFATCVQAVFNFSQKSFDEWTRLQHEGRRAYLAGESTDVFPCMYGNFHHNGHWYFCDASGIIGLITVDK